MVALKNKFHNLFISRRIYVKHIVFLKLIDQLITLDLLFLYFFSISFIFNMDHNDCRLHLCLLCFNRAKEMKKINENHLKTISEHFINGYNVNDERLPAALCGNCRTIVQDYSSFSNLPPKTRQSISCSCKLCLMAKSPPGNLSSSSKVKKKRGRPSSGPSDNSNLAVTTLSCVKKISPVTMCNFCLTQ